MIAPIYESPRGLTFDERYGPDPVLTVRVPPRSVIEHPSRTVPDAMLAVPVDDCVSLAWSAEDVIWAIMNDDGRFAIIDVYGPFELPLDPGRN